MNIEKFVEYKSRIKDHFEMLRNHIYVVLLCSGSDKLKDMLNVYEQHLVDVLPLLDGISLDNDIDSLQSVSMGIGCTGKETSLLASEMGIEDSVIDVIVSLSGLIESELDSMIEEWENM